MKKLYTTLFVFSLFAIIFSCTDVEEELRGVITTDISLEGIATDEEVNEANYQLKQVLKSLGLGILVILPFSPISIPYILKKAKEFEIDLIPDWYKALSKDEDRIE